MSDTTDQLELLVVEVSDAAEDLRSHITISAIMAKHLFDTQAMFLTHLKK
jgi:hypothetical protein